MVSLSDILLYMMYITEFVCVCLSLSLCVWLETVQLASGGRLPAAAVVV